MIKSRHRHAFTDKLDHLSEDTAPSGIHQLIDLIKTAVTLLSDMLVLILLEAKLAKKSLMALCGIAAIIFILIASTWLCLLGAIFLLLSTEGFNGLSIFLMLAAFNLLLILLMRWIAQSHLKNLGFPATRKQLTRRRQIESAP